MSLGDQFSAFIRIMLPENKDSTSLRNVRKNPSNDTACHPINGRVFYSTVTDLFLHTSATLGLQRLSAAEVEGAPSRVFGRAIKFHEE
jgi:hypothetical protein